MATQLAHTAINADCVVAGVPGHHVGPSLLATGR
jgi:hypothetical protein